MDGATGDIGVGGDVVVAEAVALEPEDFHLALDAGVGVMEAVVGQGSSVFGCEANRPHDGSTRGGSRSFPPAVYAHGRRLAICATSGRAEYIEQQTGVRRGLSQVRHFLKDRLGLRWRKTGAIPVPPKKTIPEHAREQAAFLRDRLEPRLEQARRCSRQVYFVDAAHFVFAPFLGCLWCTARLFVRAASGRKRHNVPGAFDAVTHRLIRVTNQGYINAESVCALLRAVAGSAVGLPITLVLDNARYQKCAVVQALAESLGIELLYLPSYSPNLNLIERLWRFVRVESPTRPITRVRGLSCRHRRVPGRLEHRA